MKHTSIAASLAGAVLIACTVASPAEAEHKSFRDELGDANAGIDITKVTVANGKRLILTSHHADLTRSDNQSIGYWIDVDGKHAGPEYVISGFFSSYSEWDMFKTRHWNRVGEPLNCRSEMRIGYKKNTARFTIWRACLDGLRGHVRVSMGASLQRENASSIQDRAPGFHRFTGWVKYGAPHS